MILDPRDALLFAAATHTPPILNFGVPIHADLLAEIDLRAYQVDLLLRAGAALRGGARRVLIQLPTGGGKTRMAAALLNGVSRLAQRGQFLVHRKELIDQTSDSFTELGLQHGFVAAERPMDLTLDLHIVGVFTLVNRLSVVLPPRLLIIDEAHHAKAATWKRVIEAYPDAWIIGLSATPERLDGRGLDDLFDAMVCGPSVAWLIEHGFLSPYDYYAPEMPDMSRVGTVAGDWEKRGAAAVMDRPGLIGDAVEHYLRLAPGEQGIVFAINREHSRNLAAAFKDRGVRAAHIDGDMDDERDRLMKAFRARDLDILTNVDLIGEGVDVPGVSYVGLNRPTQSLPLFIQHCGRGLRMFKGKTRAVIGDHAGNVFTHGMPDDDRTWSLEGRKARLAANPNADATPVRQCLQCYRISPSTVRVCPGCGAETAPNPRVIAQQEGELRKLERETLKRQAEEDRKAKFEREKAEERECRSVEALTDLGRSRGYPFPKAWARQVIDRRQAWKKRFR